MELPDDVIAIVREFSRPITRPDWRHLHIMTAHRLHQSIGDKFNKTNLPVIEDFIRYRRDHHYRYVFTPDWSERFHTPIAHIVFIPDERIIFSSKRYMRYRNE